MPQEFARLARLLATLAGFTVLAACGGGGGSLGGSGGGGGGGGGGGSTVTVSGKITFDRLPFRTTANGGLNGATPIESPARQVVVEAVSGSSAVATTTTDANGDYSMSVPANTNISIRARARMLKTGSAPTWSFTVRNNANSDAIYALQGDSFNSGSTNLTRNLRATSGWGGSSYTGTRAAAPFAILDTVYRTKELILGAAPSAAFPELNLYWSIENRSSVSQFCPDDGDIGTSFYFRDPSGTVTDDCDTPARLPDGIYILGDYANGNGDTDEFDAHVIAHEFGHYFEDRFSRSDSIGGEHGSGDRLDLRVAFGEGWGNAFGAMSLGDPQYRDSSSGISQDFGFNLETGSTLNQGWYSEASVGEILWDVFDTTAESGDSVTLGFAPIFAVMTGAQVETDALTSIFSFATALRAQNGGSASSINALLSRENIDGTDAFGAGESHNGGDSRALPVYDDIALNTPKTGVCSSSVAGSTDGNKLGNRRFLRFVNNTSRLVTITAQGAASVAGTIAATDPDILVFRRGQIVLAGESATAGLETISQQQLAAGTYILDVYDYDVTGTNQSPRCMTVSIQGN